MSQPFSQIPDPGFPRRRRRFEPGIVQEAVQAATRKLRAATREAKRHGQELWRSGKRHPRSLGLAGGAVALTLVGAYTLNASGAGRSLCPPKTQKASFTLLMDKVPHAAVGSELEIYYDVCGLSSGTAYKGRVRLLQQQRSSGKNGAAKPKPLAASFQDKVDGPATRRRHQLELGTTRPGAYTLELSVVDNKGRERKKLQKVVIKTR
jgi:hypothetical protein